MTAALAARPATDVSSSTLPEDLMAQLDGLARLASGTRTDAWSGFVWINLCGIKILASLSYTLWEHTEIYAGGFKVTATYLTTKVTFGDIVSTDTIRRVTITEPPTAR